MEVIIGMDNGSTGTYAIYVDGKLKFFGETPHKLFRKPTIKDSNFNRLDWKELKEHFERIIGVRFASDRIKAVIERPISTSIRFQATLSSQRFMEALLIVMEDLEIPVMTVDSSVWQKHYFPDVHGSDQLKEASRLIGRSMFPEYSALIDKHGDADGLLIATALIEKKFEFLADCDRIFAPKKTIKKKAFKSNV